jgi:hypothetical protein
MWTGLKRARNRICQVFMVAVMNLLQVPQWVIYWIDDVTEYSQGVPWIKDWKQAHVRCSLKSRRGKCSYSKLVATEIPDLLDKQFHVIAMKIQISLVKMIFQYILTSVKLLQAVSNGWTCFWYITIWNTYLTIKKWTKWATFLLEFIRMYHSTVHYFQNKEFLE